MKRHILIFVLVVAMLPQVKSQDDGLEKNYRRNALATMMIYHPKDEFGYDVYNIFKNLPEQEKYDEHQIGLRVIEETKITGVKKGPGLHRQEYGKSIVLTQAEKEANAQAILKVLNDAQVGNRLVAKWFGLSGDDISTATFNTSLIESRGAYDVSALDALKAQYTIDGAQALLSASDELLEHTFVLVSDMMYITAEDRAEVASAVLKVLTLADECSGRNIDAMTKSFTGFKVMTHSYLYQLEWNDSIANEFFVKYYTQTPDIKKVQAFMNDKSLFRMKYVAQESCNFERTKIKDKYNRTELLALITNRSIDKNIAKLQRNYPAFQVKTPVLSVETDAKGKNKIIKAAIGMKEGLDDVKNVKFSVVEPKLDPKTLQVEYDHVAVVEPIKGEIWDNRFNAVMEMGEGAELSGTSFKQVSGGTILPGMLLVQDKK